MTLKSILWRTWAKFPPSPAYRELEAKYRVLEANYRELAASHQALEARSLGPKVLANGLPKSGTHLLLKTLSLFPYLDSIHSFYIDANTEDLTDKLKSLEKGQYISGHMYWSEEFVVLLKENNIKPLFMIRDLRDVVLSFAHYVTYHNKSHRLSPYFNSLPDDDERLLAAILGTPGPPVDNVPGFGSIAKHARGFAPWLHEPICCTVRFEDLVGTEGGSTHQRQLEAIQQIAAHIGVKLSEKQAIKIAEGSYSEKSSTFRKGKIGDWQNHFKDIHKQAMKDTANEFLLTWGYIDNPDW